MKRLAFLFLSIIPLLFLGSCNDAARQQALRNAERDSLRRVDSASLKVGVLPTVESLPIVVAEHLDLFHANGVEVHLRHYHALAECRKALLDSLVEGAVIDSTLLAQLNGERIEACAHADEKARVPLIGTAPQKSSMRMLVSMKSRVTRVSQLADKIIATDSHGDSYRLASQTVDSLRKKQQVFLITVEDLGVRTSMIVSGNVDCALLPEPYASKAVKGGAKELGGAVLRPNPWLYAFRTTALGNAGRRAQHERFCKAIAVASDSIRRYGVRHYDYLLKW